VQKCDAAKPAATFDYRKFRSQDFRHLAKMSTKSDGPRRAIRELAENGVSVVVLPPLPGTFLDDAAMLSAAGALVIGLTCDMTVSTAFGSPYYTKCLTSLYTTNYHYRQGR
jgi:hypothetical protein